MRTTALMPTLAVLAITIILGACSRAMAPEEPVRAVRTMTVSAEPGNTTLEYAAEIKARTESRLGFRVSGKMVRRNVDMGDPVKAGQVLAQLDPEDLRFGQDAARATLAAARANLDQATADFRRFKELRDEGFISSAELERRETTLKASQAQFDQARAQANVQANQAAYSALVADANGVVTAVEAEPGMVLAAGSPIVRLAHDGPRDVVFSVPEDKIVLIKALAEQGTPLSVRLWTNHQPSLHAKIREIAAAADPVTRTYLVKADIGRADVKLGQTATARLELPAAAGVTKLPLSALRENRGETMVWVVDRSSMTVREQPVRISGADGNLAVVDDGLAPGQVVVTAGVHVLNPGQKVKFYEEASTPSLARKARENSIAAAQPAVAPGQVK